MNKNYKQRMYTVMYDRLNHCFIVKSDDRLMFPICTIPIPLGNRDAKEKAKEKAFFIAASINKSVTEETYKQIDKTITIIKASEILSIPVSAIRKRWKTINK